MSDRCCSPDAGSRRRPWTNSGTPAKVTRASGADVLDGALMPLEGGRFVMGTDQHYGYAEDGEGPSHEVRVSSFSISRCAVTNAQFNAFVEASGYKTEAE